MKKYVICKDNNFIKIKSLGLSLLITTNMLFGAVSCDKKEDVSFLKNDDCSNTSIENSSNTVFENSEEIILDDYSEGILDDQNQNESNDPPSNMEDEVPEDYYYDLNSYEFVENKFCILNSEFLPSEQSYNNLINDINNYKYNTSFMVVSLNDGMSFGYNVDNEYWSASTIKCAYALYVCRLIDEGRASFDDVLTVTSKFNSVGSGKIRYMERGTQLTLKEVLYYTLHYSDNQGYHMLVDKFKKDEFNLMMINIGCDDMVLPNTSRFCDANCRSFALVWQEILNYCNDGTETGKFLYDLLLNAKYNYIADGITDKPSLHKSGWYQGWVCNDTGVVLNEENPYILIILTENDGMNQIINLAKDIDIIMEEYSVYLKRSYTKHKVLT